MKSTIKLWQLFPGEQFIDKATNRIFTVIAHDGQMTEVRTNGKNWAWPNTANVIPV